MRVVVSCSYLQVFASSNEVDGAHGWICGEWQVSRIRGNAVEGFRSNARQLLNHVWFAPAMPRVASSMVRPAQGYNPSTSKCRLGFPLVIPLVSPLFHIDMRSPDRVLGSLARSQGMAPVDAWHVSQTERTYQESISGPPMHSPQLLPSTTLHRSCLLKTPTWPLS